MLRVLAVLAVALGLVVACSPAALELSGAPEGQGGPRGSAAALASSGAASPAAASARPPPPGLTPDARFPKVEHEVLDNGLALHVVELLGAPVVHLRLVVRSGSATDGPKPGLARLTAEQMRAGGAGPWSARQVQDRLDRLGAELRTSTTPDATRFELEVAAPEVEEAVAILAAAATRPRLSLKSLSRARLRLSEQARERAEHRADFTAEAVLRRELYELPTSVHPYAILGASAEQLRALSLADTQRWWRTHVTPENALLVAVGDLRTTALKPAMEQAFRAWKGTAPPSPTYTPPLPPARVQVHLIDHRRATDSELRLGMLGPNLRSQYMPALEVGLQLLGERLRALRESANVRVLEVVHGPVPIVVSARAPTADTPLLAEAILAELAKLVQHQPPEIDTDAAARRLTTELWSLAETSSGVASLVELSQMQIVPNDYFDERPAQWRKVKPRHVHEIARRYLSPEYVRLVVAGDAGRLGPALPHFGTVHVLDPGQGLTIRKKIAHDPSASLLVKER